METAYLPIANSSSFNLVDEIENMTLILVLASSIIILQNRTYSSVLPIVFQSGSSLLFFIALRRQWHPTPVLLPGKSVDGGVW